MASMRTGTMHVSRQSAMSRSKTQGRPRASKPHQADLGSQPAVSMKEAGRLPAGQRPQQWENLCAELFRPAPGRPAVPRWH